MKYLSNANLFLSIWDEENGKKLCQFVNGEYETNDKREIEILDSVAAQVDAPIRREGKPGPAIKDPDKQPIELKLKDMGIPQLKKIAKAENINIPLATSKNAIIEVIEAARNPESAE